MTMHSLFVNVSFGFPGTDSRVYGGKVFLWICSWQSNSYVQIYVTSVLYPVPMGVQLADFSGQKSADSDIFYTGARGQHLQVQVLAQKLQTSRKVSLLLKSSMTTRDFL
jgi:hypothetical protein